ncbi:MAG: hypothetical protein K5656_09965 [Lachnospiraceae bacterium]|nr:hypothetical protein [Lachnospiraceae bacterium]
MADAKITSEFGEFFSDYEPDTEQLDTLDDDNEGIYDLLGMSNEEKEQAHKQLADEDSSLGGPEGGDSSSETSDTSSAPEASDSSKAETAATSTDSSEMTMEEKAKAEALEFMKQMNASDATEENVDDSVSADDSSSDSADMDMLSDLVSDSSDKDFETEVVSDEEDRLDNMLDDIFAEEGANEADQATEDSAIDMPSTSDVDFETETTLDTPDEAIVEDVPVMSEEEPAVTEDLPSEEAQDALAQMNSIIDNAANKAEEDASESVVEATLEPVVEPADHLDLKSVETPDLSDVDLVDYNSVDISDDLLSEIDITEDLTKILDEDGDFNPEEPPLTKRELKKKLKEEAKAAKKAAKEAKKLEKAARKLKPEDKDPNDIIADLETAFAEEDIVSTMEKVADVGVEGAASESVEDVDLNQFLGGDSEEGAEEEKKSFKEKFALLLFGEPEEGDFPTEEELAKKQAEKEAKAAAKEKAKEEKEIKKKEAAEAKALKKNQAKEIAVVKKAAAQDKKAKIAAEEEAEDAKEKKINPKQVVTTFVILAVLAVTVVLGTNEFNYHMVITRATNYFEMQKYRKAYDQIVGVDVKDRDKEIKDKIYCVMYVQQQLDSYKNFCKMEMYENALDALVKGVRKYNEHYEEAKAMGISKDLDGLSAEIEKELLSRYGISIDTVNSWMGLDQASYTNTIFEYVSDMNLPTEHMKEAEEDAIVKEEETVEE